MKKLPPLFLCASLFLFHSGCIAKPASIVGKQCFISYENVVVVPNKTSIQSWPDDVNVEENLKGSDYIKSHIGNVIFKTKYNLDDEDEYWKNRDIYIVKVKSDYFLVVKEGLTKCHNMK